MDLIYTSSDRPDLKYQSLAEKILLQMRGSRTQRELSEAMGFSFNQVGKWESGATIVRWNDFLAIGETVGIPVETEFRRMLTPFFDGEYTPVNVLSPLCRYIDLSKAPWPQNTIRKWLKGDLSPALADVLRLLSLNPAVLIGALSVFVDCAKLETLRDFYNLVETQADLVMNDPICVYVNSALGVKPYTDLTAHNDDVLALHAACTVEELRRSLASMHALGLIEFRDGKYRPNSFNFSFSGTRNRKVRALTKYTTLFAGRRYPLLPLETPPGSETIPNVGIGSVRVNAVSIEASKKIADVLSRASSEIAKIVQEDKDPKTGVQIILMHSFPSTLNADGKS